MSATVIKSPSFISISPAAANTFNALASFEVSSGIATVAPSSTSSKDLYLLEKAPIGSKWISAV